MANKQIAHIKAKLEDGTVGEVLDIYDEKALHSDDIANNLSTATSGKILDAVQGKILNDSIDATNSELATTNSNLTTLISRVNAIATLPSGSTSGDAELIDIRTGFDGTTYANAGTSVRSQVSDLNNKIDILLNPVELFDPETGIAENDFYITVDGEFLHSDEWQITKFIELGDNMSYTYTGITHPGVAPYSCFYDQDRNVISTFKQSTGKNSLEIPEGAKKVKFSIHDDDMNTFSVIGTPTISVSQTQNEINDIINDIEEINSYNLPSLISVQNTREYGIDNSAWSWWTYPQVECDDVVRHRAYFGEVNSIGIAGVGSSSLSDPSDTSKTNLCKVGKDDHNGMALFKNRVATSGLMFMAFGFTHNEDNYIRLYMGCVEHNGDLYKDPILIEFPGRTTYAQVFNTKESSTYSQNHLLLITRVDITEWWGVFSNTYYGNSWGTPQPIIKADRQYYVIFRETTTDGLLRMVMYSNPNLTRTDTRIRMGFLDMHTGNIYNSDGTTLLGSMSDGGVDYSAFDIIVDADGYDSSKTADDSNELRNRLLDVAITAPENPYIAYAKFRSATDAEYYVYYNGATIDVTACGNAFYTPSVYVGGLIFIPRNPNTIYLSRKVDHRSRIEKWVYSNGAYSLDSEIDRGDADLVWCIRPIVNKDGTALFYQKGSSNAANFAEYNYDAKFVPII